jgi:hypothetical protein
MHKTFLITLTLLALFLIDSSKLHAEVFAKVIYVDGDPVVLRKFKKFPIKKGDFIHFSDKIKTSKDEKVTLEDDRGNKIYVLSSSSLKLPPKRSKDLVFNQEEGSLWFKLKPVPKKESFTVRTPTAVAGVRGTKFITMIFDDKTTDLCVCEGEVTIEVNGVKTSAKTGQGVTAKPEAKKPGAIFDNQTFIRQRRRLSRKPVCMNCHSGSGSYAPSSLEDGGLILR